MKKLALFLGFLLFSATALAAVNERVCSDQSFCTSTMNQEIAVNQPSSVELNQTEMGMVQGDGIYGVYECELVAIIITPDGIYGLEECTLIGIIITFD